MTRELEGVKKLLTVRNITGTEFEVLIREPAIRSSKNVLCNSLLQRLTPITNQDKLQAYALDTLEGL